MTTLSTRPPSSVEKAFSTAVPFQLRKTFGDCEIGGSWTRIRAPMDFACALAGNHAKARRDLGRRDFRFWHAGRGVHAAHEPDVDGTYYLRVEPNRNRLVFDLWMPGARTPQIPHYPHFLESERPLELQPGQRFRMKILADDTVCVAYINDRIALTARMYNLRSGEWGVFVNEGSAAFEHISLMTSTDVLQWRVALHVVTPKQPVFGLGAHAPPLAGCPIDLEERRQVEPVPDDATDHGEEPSKAMGHSLRNAWKRSRTYKSKASRLASAPPKRGRLQGLSGPMQLGSMVRALADVQI